VSHAAGKLPWWILLGLAGFVLACAPARPPQPVPPKAAPEVPAPPPPGPSVSGAQGLAGVGAALVKTAQTQWPQSLTGRVVLAWPRSEPWLKPAAAAAKSALPNAVLVSELGLSADRAENLYTQLDPSSFSVLFWMESGPAESGSLDSVQLKIWPLQAASPETLTCQVSPPVSLAGAAPALPPEAAAEPLPAPWLSLSAVPAALGWEPGERRLWYVAGGRVVRFDPLTRMEDNSWAITPPPPPPPQPDSGSPAPSQTGAAPPAGHSSQSASPPAQPGVPVITPGKGFVLRWVPAEGPLGAMGLFSRKEGWGRWYERSADQGWQPGAALPSFPMSTRLSRFFSAPFDSQTGGFQLINYNGETLGEFVNLVKVKGPGWTVIVCRNSDGSVWGVRGDLLTRIAGPADFPADAIAGAGPWVFLATSTPPYSITAYRLNADHTWESTWTSPVLPGPVTAMTVGTPDKTATLFAAVSSPGSTDGVIYRLTPPIPSQEEPPGAGGEQQGGDSAGLPGM
jgi:hypothetical protein